MNEENLNIETTPSNQQTFPKENSENGTFAGWVKKHKKDIIIGGTITVVGIVGGILIVKNWDAITDGIQALISTSKKGSVVTKTQKVVFEAAVPMEEITKDIITDKPRALLNAGEEFDVSRHLRILSTGRKASQSKISQAAALGIKLDEHQTWVETYTKNCA
jgi:hypothetical protein